MMKCQKCQSENPEDSKFCLQCGGQIELECLNCGKLLPATAKFCNECGHHLTQPSEHPPRDLSIDKKLDKIQRYLPKGLIEKILAQRDKIEGERKQVTIMFCDMEGFTPLVEKLGPDEAYGVMDQVYEILIHKVHEYEGTVNEMTGDGVMALFGAPIALEDAPQRAIRSAIAIHRETARFNDKAKAENKSFAPLKFRIGIHTGPVVVGTLGNDLRVEFKAVGETVNLASRLESLAEPGTTYVSQETFKHTEGLFRYEALGEREIKGKKGGVHVYRVIAPSTRRTRFDVATERGLTRFVGRERELELLLDSFERSKEGRGQAVSIVSDAGIGKSRLLYEFRKAVTHENVNFLEGRCLSYGRNAAYHPVVDIIKVTFGIQDHDTDHAIKEKVASGLQFLGIEESLSVPFFLELLSVKNSGIDQAPMSPEARRHRTLEALKELILKGAEYRPVIMAIEDLHWMDRSSEDALREILESISAARVLLVFTYRPDFVHTWGSRSYHSQVTLNRLSNRESLAMIRYILGTPEIAQNLEELILRKTEGIPFFIEEFIKSLKELGAIERKGQQYQLTEQIEKPAIPSTIQDVIMARVDIIPEGAREVLRIGSAIEREFSHDLIKRLAHLPEKELLSHLSSLKDSELLYERGIYPESTYIFKHALTREVVYDSILKSKRKELHEKIASTIEESYKENLYDQYGVIAGHFIAGENDKKGAEYSRLEAKKYQKAGLFKDAIENQKSSINCLERLPQKESIQKKIIDARTTLANYHLTLTQNPEAKDAVEPVMELALKLNYRKRLPGIYTAMGLYALWVKEDFSSGVPYINDALNISEEIGDFLSFWLANFNLSMFFYFQCEFERAFSHIKKCLDLSEASNNVMGISASRGLMSQLYCIQGNISLACKVGEEALHFAEKSGDIATKNLAITLYGSALYHKGIFDTPEKYLLEGLINSQKASQFFTEVGAAWYLGHLYYEMGAYSKALDYYNKAINTIELGKIFTSGVNAIKTSLARTGVRARTEGQDANLSALFEYYDNNKFNAFKGMIARDIGDILMQMDDEHMTDSEVWIKKGIDLDKINATRWYLATDHALYADWFKMKRDLSGAREQLIEAIKIFRECGADGWVNKYDKELNAIS